MATNKKKDAASLFELIDKSTLKVPKSGALKIPSWYSSKTNPPTQSAPGSTGVHVSGGANGNAAPTVRQIQPTPRPQPTPEVKAESASVTPLPAPAAPSATPAPQLTPKAFAPFGTTHVEKTAMTPIPPQKGIFAPVVPGSSHSKNKVILLSTVCGFIALVLLIVIISQLGKTRPSNATPPQQGGTTTGQQVSPPGPDGSTPIGGSHIAGGDIGTQVQNPSGQNNGNKSVNTTLPNNGGANQQIVTPGKGTIQESKAIDWSKEPEGLNYIVIANYSGQREDLARKAAELLANNGVDVVFFRGKNESISIFMRQGFPPAAKAEAEAAIARIRKIGELHPDFKKTNTSVFANPFRAKLNFATGK